MSSLRLLRHNCPHLKGPKYDLKIYVDDAVIQCTYMYTSYAYFRLWVNSSGFCIMSSPGLGMPRHQGDLLDSVKHRTFVNVIAGLDIKQSQMCWSDPLSSYVSTV